MEWNFDSALRPYLAAPEIWSRIDLRTCAAFRSKYALTLYEMLSLRVGLRGKFWDVGVDELRSLCGSGNRLSDFNAFSRRVLAPAIHEINALSHFSVVYDPVAAKFSKRIERVVFRIRKENAMRDPGLRNISGSQGCLFDEMDERTMSILVGKATMK